LSPVGSGAVIRDSGHNAPTSYLYRGATKVTVPLLCSRLLRGDSKLQITDSYIVNKWENAHAERSKYERNATTTAAAEQTGKCKPELCRHDVVEERIDGAVDVNCETAAKQEPAVLVATPRE